jgi:hypothetical protein
VLRRARELLFVSERALVGAGHDFVPLVFAPGPGGAWELADELDKKPAKEKEAAGGDGGGVAAARAMWQTKAKTGESKSKEDDSSWKKHQSPITFMQVRRARARGGGATRMRPIDATRCLGVGIVRAAAARGARCATRVAHALSVCHGACLCAGRLGWWLAPQPLAGDGVTWSHFSTSSLDGRLATWEMPSKFIK